ncbi:hypothetical protein BU26DRAFT_247197 [Trematosphaeria pertusa]|uniref:Uncharacterized protein n=1 Tax=Trematosphaeria pertusa TaxID=390896 RepID=A0A6A6IMZ1_9PLEO|nr:uncharacterized protein BU26DRAFT_247197 [Trematosphaeria pertusa]KAF2251935.1 hypothetical protein BU26DRAFT_247197 [Trematosphaeria pertusa]
MEERDHAFILQRMLLASTCSTSSDLHHSLSVFTCRWRTFNHGLDFSPPARSCISGWICAGNGSVQALRMIMLRGSALTGEGMGMATLRRGKTLAALREHSVMTLRLTLRSLDVIDFPNRASAHGSCLATEATASEDPPPLRSVSRFDVHISPWPVPPYSSIKAFICFQRPGFRFEYKTCAATASLPDPGFSAIASMASENAECYQQGELVSEELLMGVLRSSAIAVNRGTNSCSWSSTLPASLGLPIPWYALPPPAHDRLFVLSGLHLAADYQ